MSARPCLARVRALYLKELRGYFDTPAAYVATIVLLLISGYLFASPLFLHNRAVLDSFTGTAPLLLLFFMPAVTMRLYAEEFKAGTYELLATLPVLDEEILAAKFLAAMTLFSFMLAGTLLYPATLAALGRPDWGAVLGAYAGLWLMAACLAAIGAWASSWTRNQVVAFIIAFMIGFALFIAGKVHGFMPPAPAAVADFLGLDSHLDRMARGVIDTRDLVYYLSLAGYFLYLAYLNTRARRLSP